MSVSLDLLYLCASAGMLLRYGKPKVHMVGVIGIIYTKNNIIMGKAAGGGIQNRGDLKQTYSLQGRRGIGKSFI